MTKRVLLDDDGLKVSRPGVNVLSAAKSDLLFSSDWSQVGLFDRGSVTLTWGSEHLGSTAGSWSSTVNFGESFDTIPLVAFTLTRDGIQMPVGDISGFTYAQVEKEVPEGGDFPVDVRGFTVRGTVATNRLILRSNYWRPAADRFSPLSSDGTVIGYSIMRYNL